MSCHVMSCHVMYTSSACSTLQLSGIIMPERRDRDQGPAAHIRRADVDIPERGNIRHHHNRRGHRGGRDHGLLLHGQGVQWTAVRSK